jgi:hypothetical protein
MGHLTVTGSEAAGDDVEDRLDRARELRDAVTFTDE